MQLNGQVPSIVPPMPAVPPHLRPLIQPVVDRLVLGDEAGLKKDGIYPHEDGDLFEFVRSYGATLIPQPQEFWENEYSMILDVNDGWVIELPLWIAPHDQSELNLRIEVDTSPNLPRVWIRGID